jgi:tRNA pseudouridine55 synthase
LILFAFLNVNKPLGLTSHDVVARVRRLLRERNLKHVKVGHAGTLDPLATGVLVVCLGAATRLSEYVMNHDKTYCASITLGVETETYDAEGETVSSVDASHISRAEVERALWAYVGDIAQIPPMYSAIKQSGRKLYDLARAGQVVEREPRPVTIHAIKVEEFTADQPVQPTVVCEVKCSAGTYIRSLAHDLGAVLGVGAHLTGLERTASGEFVVDAAVTLEQLAAAEDWTPFLTDPLDALASMPQLVLSPSDWEEISHGRVIPAPDTEAGQITAGVMASQLRAILRADSGQWHPHKVFLPTDLD